MSHGGAYEGDRVKGNASPEPVRAVYAQTLFDIRRRVDGKSLVYSLQNQSHG